MEYFSSLDLPAFPLARSQTRYPASIRISHHDPVGSLAGLEKAVLAQQGHENNPEGKQPPLVEPRYNRQRYGSEGTQMEVCHLLDDL